MVSLSGTVQSLRRAHPRVLAAVPRPGKATPQPGKVMGRLGKVTPRLGPALLPLAVALCAATPLAAQDTSVIERAAASRARGAHDAPVLVFEIRSEEHTSELQSRENLVCRLLLEKI